MSITRTCNGCNRVVAENDPHAARNLPLPGGVDGAKFVDWCGECVDLIRVHLPKLAAAAREARRQHLAEPIRSRALSIWRVPGVGAPPGVLRIPKLPESKA